MKRTTTMIAIGATALFFTACGGGSSSSGDTTPLSGQAFYIDSAVSGIDYQCGSKTGTTLADGSFNFEGGQDCTFSLPGDIILRDIAADELKPGGNIYETDIHVARVLQSLDKDHDLTNGITITYDIIEKMQQAGHNIAKLPTTDAEIDNLVKLIAENGGMYVSTEDARNHLESNNPNLYSFGVIDAMSKNDPDELAKVIKLTYNPEGNRETRIVESVSAWTGSESGTGSCEMSYDVSNYTYDLANNQVTETITTKYPTGSDEKMVFKYTFDNNEVLTKAELIENGQIEETFNFYYSNTGILEKVTGKDFLATFDKKGQLIHEEDVHNGVKYPYDYEYSEKGQMIKQKSSNTVIEYSYYDNGMLKMTKNTYTDPTGGVQTWTQNYSIDGFMLDGNGNPVTCQKPSL